MNQSSKQYPVSIVRCSSYSREEVRNAVNGAVSLLDLDKEFFETDGPILLKPNLLSRRAPDRAVTTHPAVLEAVINTVRSRAPNAKLRIGDSPGGALKRIESFWKKAGFTDISEETGVPLISFENAGSKAFTSDTFRTLESFSLANAAFDSSMIINVPKMKTHSLTYMTCAMKNLYGLIPGLQKAAIHKALPDHSEFSRFITYLNTLIRPALHIVDAVVSMDGNGPSSGNPNKTGLIVAGTDSTAVDMAVCCIMGIPPMNVTYIREAAAAGIGPASGEDLDILGERIENVRPASFRLPSSYTLKKILSGIAIRMFRKFIWSRPCVDPAECSRCGKCIESCPVQAMEFTETGISIDYSSCINCLCCHELCDNDAVKLEFSFLAKRLFNTEDYGKKT